MQGKLETFSSAATTSNRICNFSNSFEFLYPLNPSQAGVDTNSFFFIFRSEGTKTEILENAAQFCSVYCDIGCCYLLKTVANKISFMQFDQALFTCLSVLVNTSFVHSGTIN